MVYTSFVFFETLTKKFGSKLEMNAKPTENQAKFLENRGIALPPTKKGCHRFISFIKDGNGTVGASESERIAIIKSQQKKWNGKKVRVYGALGIMRYIFPRSNDEVRDWADLVKHVHPFDCIVDFEYRKGVCKSLSAVELCEDSEVGHHQNT